MAQMETRLDESEARHRQSLGAINDTRILLFAANLLTKVLDKISILMCLPEDGGPVPTDKPHSATRYTRLASWLEEKTFVPQTGLPQSCYKTVKKYRKRNEVAYETGVEFAQLLMTDEYRNSHVYKKWAELFTFAYGRTIEEAYNDNLEELEDLIGENA
ncbi:hypothetical protein MMC30_005756 [Trapelia coarctata]|nr:hypothetical protein [Trapelia coarctata]